MPEITRLLVANRGEIARRVVRTCDLLGVETVAVFSEPDRRAPFVDEATYAVALGGTTSAESYLDAAKVLDAARRSGADAVHPGYGFLSENAEFAEAVVAAGLVWVGPTPSSMRAMSLKVEAKRIAAASGVPLVPGAELDVDASDDALLVAAAGVGYPVLVKASAGGGGKGMRIVRTAGGLLEAVAGARREASSSFGDPTVFLERYLERSRHIEVQVFGDTHGNVVHLFERECSIQRRHQKIVEESPSPGATAVTLEAMYAASLSLARAIGYVGAGTVEFLVSGDEGAQEFFFLEMNTRLQVEHPVTEMVTGLDLVAWQLAVAGGQALPLVQEAITRKGHAVEVRLYAEDPARDFLPGSGVIADFSVRDYRTRLRVDSGVEDGSLVTPYYDPMLAKVIALGRTRTHAAQLLAGSLRTSRVTGVTTNLMSLVSILESQPFLDGDTTTAFLDEHPEVLEPTLPVEVRRLHLAACAVALLDPALADGPVGSGGVPARAARGWRNVGGVPEVVTVRYRDGARDVVAALARAWGREGPAYWICADVDPILVAAQTIPTDARFERLDGVRLESAPRWPRTELRPARLEVDGIRRALRCGVSGDRVEVDLDRWISSFTVVEPWARSEHGAGSGGPSTPVPGTVTHVAVAVGDVVAVGAALVVLEAMKMEHTIRADLDGVVAEVHVSVGQSVDAHTVVVTLTSGE